MADTDDGSSPENITEEPSRELNSSSRNLTTVLSRLRLKGTVFSAGVAVLVFGLWLGSWYFVPRWYPIEQEDGTRVASPDSPGMFGDMFGAVNSLFAGLSLLGVVVALLVQTHELKEQRLDQIAQLRAIRDLSEMQNQLLGGMQGIMSTQSTQAHVHHLQSLLDVVNDRLVRARNEIPKSWTSGSPEAMRREQGLAHIAALEKRRDSIENELQSLLGETQ
ncbi:MAG: hypothetical protein ACF8PN_07240 [Phycisphaerales bacterium]